MLVVLCRARQRKTHRMTKPHDAKVVEAIKKQVENLISWAPDFGAVEIKITFHEGKIVKTEEKRTVAIQKICEV